MSANPLGIPVVTLPGPMPAGPVILAEELERRSEVTDLREQALAELAQARLDADAIREVAVRAAEREIEQLKQRAREDAIAEAVQWLCDENEMERVIASQLTVRWRTLTAQTLERLLSKADQNELMLRRVESEVAQLMPQSRLTLYVEPGAVIAAARAYAATPEIAVVADSRLAAGQARLDNGLVRIHLDERAYQAQLLQQLTGDMAHAAYA